MPSRGSGPQPKISAGDSAIRRTAPANVMRAGVFTSPAPRNAADSKATTHSGTEPANTMFE